MMISKLWPALGLASLVLLGSSPSDEDGRRSLARQGQTAGRTTRWTPPRAPKPLTPTVLRGLRWLVDHQHENGGWGQGEESLHMRGSQLAGQPNVGDTCTAALALLRAGHSPTSGEHAEAVRAALRFVAAEVAASDPGSLSVTSTQGTRLQAKLGPYVDTFLASMFLSEIVPTLQGDDDLPLAAAALATVVDKIESHQRDDGTWDDRGWAPVLSQAIAAKGLHRAALGGVAVSDAVRLRTLGYASDRVDQDGMSTDAAGSAGVALYSAGTIVSTLADTLSNGESRQARLREELAAAPDEVSAKALQAQLDDLASELEGVRAKNELAQESLARRLSDPAFVAGFGSNGGEEFLSYMNISESLVVAGGAEWEQWDGKMTSNLSRIQNNDGSWSGHHCITGRTFCTASALLVLMADRMPVPASEEPTGEPEAVEQPEAVETAEATSGPTTVAEQDG